LPWLLADIENRWSRMSVHDAEIEHALARGAGQQIGRYRLDLATGVWWWSSETFLMHGFAPGDVVPTTALVLAHKHPDDRDRVRQVLEQARRTGEPFSSLHRIMDARGRERSLVVVGQGRRRADTGHVVELLGYFIDVTQTVRAEAAARAERDIAAAAHSRGPIDQAKGMVALACAVDPEEAFRRLRRVSNDRNVPLRELAEQVVGTATSGAPDVVRRVVEMLR
jgi:PAS domain S-box-containing protein